MPLSIRADLAPSHRSDPATAVVRHLERDRLDHDSGTLVDVPVAGVGHRSGEAGIARLPGEFRVVALEVEDPGVVRATGAIHPERVPLEVDGRRPRSHRIDRLLRLADGDGSSEQGHRDKPQSDGEGDTENLAHVRFLLPPGRSAPATVSPPGAAVNG